MAPPSTPPRDPLNVFGLDPRNSVVCFILLAVVGILLLIQRRRNQQTSQHVEASLIDLAPDEKPTLPLPYQPVTAAQQLAMPLLPPDMSSPFFWEFPPAPPMSQLNSGDLARIAKSRMEGGIQQAQGDMEETWRRHSYPTPNELDGHSGRAVEEDRRVMRRRETIQFFGGGPQNRVWKRRTLEFE